LIIKRYENRKLYDTEARQYITLEGIAGLIRAGRQVQVLDHASGEDLTAVVLTQIIFEQEKKQSGFLPRPVLTGLVQAGGDTLSALRRSLAAPLDLLRQIDEEIDRRIQALINRGELAEEEAHRWRDRLLLQPRPSPEETGLEQQRLEQALAKRGLPTRDDLQKLAAQLETLAARIDELAPPQA
jgi:polyhydroxyalkanoate synthesis repressor PhaR